MLVCSSKKCFKVRVSGRERPTLQRFLSGTAHSLTCPRDPRSQARRRHVAALSCFLAVGAAVLGKKIGSLCFPPSRRVISSFANVLTEQAHRDRDPAWLVKYLPCYALDGLYRNAELYILTANKKMPLKDFLVWESFLSSPESCGAFEKRFPCAWFSSVLNILSR